MRLLKMKWTLLPANSDALYVAHYVFSFFELKNPPILLVLNQGDGPGAASSGIQHRT